MRLALRPDHPVEWLALRARVLPHPTPPPGGGEALSRAPVAAAPPALRRGTPARLGEGRAPAAAVAADLGLDPLPSRLLLDCLSSAGHVTARSGEYALSRMSRRWLDPASPLSVAGYVAGAVDYWPWWQGLEQSARTGVTSGSHGVPPDDPYWRRYIAGQLELARLSAAEGERKLTLAA